ncbi:hypothetical protein Bbelb_204250 [Branchiostoma belcheri]|nr:hypothetical protein Bbelb_204250 [Branchiostoma belcheri]
MTPSDSLSTGQKSARRGFVSVSLSLDWRTGAASPDKLRKEARREEREIIIGFAVCSEKASSDAPPPFSTRLIALNIDLQCLVEATQSHVREKIFFQTERQFHLEANLSGNVFSWPSVSVWVLRPVSEYGQVVSSEGPLGISGYLPDGSGKSAKLRCDWFEFKDVEGYTQAVVRPSQTDNNPSDHSLLLLAGLGRSETGLWVVIWVSQQAGLLDCPLLYTSAVYQFAGLVWRNNGSEVMLQRADPGDLCRAPSGLWDCLDQRSPSLLELFKVCHLVAKQQISWLWERSSRLFSSQGGRDPGHGGGHVCLKLEVMTLALGGGHVYVALEVVTLAMGAAMFVPCWSVGNNPLSVQHSLVHVRGHVKGHGDSDPLVSADLST